MVTERTLWTSVKEPAHVKGLLHSFPYTTPYEQTLFCLTMFIYKVISLQV